MSNLCHSSAAWLTTVLLIGASVGACGSDSSNRQETTTQPGTGASFDGTGSAADSSNAAGSSGGPSNAAGSGGGPSNTTDAGTNMIRLQDPQVSSVLSTINATELEQSSIAEKQAENAAVRELSQDIAASALASQERLTILASSSNLRAPLNIAEAENTFAQQLQADSMRNAEALKNAKAARFDRLYLQTQIDLQRQVLVLVDQTLAPSAQNPLLQAEVQRTRGDSVVFLERAQALSATLITLGDDDAGVPDTDAGY